MPSVITLRESSTNMERELYFDLYRKLCLIIENEWEHTSGVSLILAFIKNSTR